MRKPFESFSELNADGLDYMLRAEANAAIAQDKAFSEVRTRETERGPRILKQAEGGGVSHAFEWVSGSGVCLRCGVNFKEGDSVVTKSTPIFFRYGKQRKKAKANTEYSLLTHESCP